MLAEAKVCWLLTVQYWRLGVLKAKVSRNLSEVSFLTPVLVECFRSTYSSAPLSMHQPCLSSFYASGSLVWVDALCFQTVCASCVFVCVNTISWNVLDIFLPDFHFSVNHWQHLTVLEHESYKCWIFCPQELVLPGVEIENSIFFRMENESWHRSKVPGVKVQSFCYQR